MSDKDTQDSSTATAHTHDHDHDHDHHHHDHDHDHDHDHAHGHHHHHDDEFKFVEDPAFEVEYKGECAYEVKVSIAAVNERKRADEAFSELKGDAVVPGFRKGKAPRGLLERRFGKAVRNDVTQTLISAAFQKLIKDQDLRPIQYPDVDGLDEAKSRGADDPLVVTFKFEVSPKCELGKYRGLAVERPVLKIKDADIAEAIDTLRERSATYEVTDTPAQDGDQVLIDFVGTLDGTPFDGGSAENYPYVLGSGRFFKEFEAALVGAKSGAVVTAAVPFPEGYHGKELAGKTGDFMITVHEVKRKVLPELNDEFAKTAGYDSEADLREKVAADLREGAKEQSDRVAESRAMQQVIEGSTFEIPKSLLASAANEYIQQEMRRLANLRMPMSEIEKMMEQITADAHAHALREIKNFTAINEIGEAEGITVTDADFEKEAENIGRRTGMDVAVAHRYLSQSEQRGEYEGRIFRSKAVAVVMEHAVVTEKEVEREALDQEAEQED